MRNLAVDEALSVQHHCFGDCHSSLSAAQRTRAIEVIYHCDDALRGWDYTPIYEIDGDRLWREAQSRNDLAYRGVAVRFGECIYRRLTGSILHEVLHAVFGDPTQANYGIPFGLPYGVPESMCDEEAAEFLAKHNFCEARAFVGVWVLAERLGIDWKVLNSRDYATLCFPGGNALVPPIRGYRAAPHIDPVHHPERYLRRSRALEDDARAWFTPDRVTEVLAFIDGAAAKGRATRPHKRKSAAEIARVAPTRYSRNDACPCMSGRKIKKCCGDRVLSV